MITEQRHVYLEELPWILQATARLRAAAGLCGGVAGERFVIFHGQVSPDSDGPVEVCVPVVRRKTRQTLPAGLSPRIGKHPSE